MNSKKSPFKFIVIITLIVIAIIVALIVISNKSSDSDSEEGKTFDNQPSTEGQPTYGDTDAPVSIVEFGDFMCPACKIWGENFFPQLVSDYVDSGEANISFVNVLFHGAQSELGSLAAESVYKQNPDAYWDFHQALFNEQPSEGHDNEWLTREKIMEVAEGVPKIDTEQLKEDLDNETAMDEVNKDTKLVNKFDVKLTPTIMVNGTTIEDPFDYDEIKNAIEDALEEGK
ncbi:DsbA family protein [Lentibacillus sp. Marseille-P4043]|uniref:DsbA family protein n=1 Tax=Lentibacillus sp. Marseille-P4043 TaxID=2040293 RepID=UPI000D0AD846|nr:thioredoxin domain-containing protein [Lentibacillus sp. Marseille-P4043]